MAASRTDLRNWFKSGVEGENLRMVVWCDAYDYEDYPEYSDLIGEALKKYTDKENGKDMKKLMEVYDLTGDLDKQMAERRAFHY